MAVSALDVFKIDVEGNHAGEPVAPFVDCELQDGATAEFLKLWRRRPREFTQYVGGPEPGCLCVLRAYPVTLEDEPSVYLAELDRWLIDYGY